MSFDNRFLSALCLCFAVFMFSGCDSATEEVVEAPEKAKVGKPKAPESDSGITKRSHSDSGSRPSNGPAEEDQVDAEPMARALPPKSEVEIPQSEKEIVKIGGFDVSLAGGALKFMAPTVWEKSKPKSRFVEYEIAVPSSGGDDNGGRLTISLVGGGVEANIARWYGQYSQPDGRETKDVAKVTKSTFGDSEVVWVDISGTLLDKAGGPMSGGPVVEREDYRMLAAIIQAGAHGQCFVKLYGPRKTIADNAEPFKAFVGTLEIDGQAINGQTQGQ